MNNPFNALAMPHAGIGQAFSQGMEAGRGQKREDASFNALSALAQNPNDQEAMTLLAQNNPQAAFAMRDRQAQAQMEARTGELTGIALNGGEGADEAMSELATINFERWSKIDASQKSKATEEAKVFGQASLDLLQVPYEQRRGRFIEYARQFPEYADEIQEIAFLPADRQDLALRGQVLDAQMIDKLHAMERQKAPNYQVIPEGATLVNTRDPNAIRQYQGQMQGGGLSVVRTGRDASGRRVVEMSDGSIQYAD